MKSCILKTIYSISLETLSSIKHASREYIFITIKVLSMVKTLG